LYFFSGAAVDVLRLRVGDEVVELGAISATAAAGIADGGAVEALGDSKDD